MTTAGNTPQSATLIADITIEVDYDPSMLIVFNIVGLLVSLLAVAAFGLLLLITKNIGDALAA